MSISIRDATEDDLPAIFALVNELAIYEKEPEAVTVTLEDYRENFRESNYFAQVAETSDGEIVGMTVSYIGFSTWNGRMLFLEDFVVTESCRGQGIGRLLFDSVVEEAKKRGAKRMKWQVLDWNTPAINFYEKYNAKIQKGWLNANLYEDGLQNAAE